MRHFLQFWRLEIPDQVPADLVLGEASLPGFLQMAGFFLCLHEAEAGWVVGEVREG